ncbi:hypothetical protein K491DRAFT_691228 [Lophiostoma macrostomum CBS 122681]|uniref:Uncharacterized protein n=1 Tax=Lophiostoma macrostomum CBS 122681 TaxID=1314788 RepID=A0A6A6TF04_9PLEO|nr:hypothetical protein K491DRAFT_691228 [Lophiostoma macrostomum CBS 122681]
MRGVLAYVILAIAATVSAIPITPAAPAAQRLVERMRAEGLDEHEIASRLFQPLHALSSFSSSSLSSTPHPFKPFTSTIHPSSLASLLAFRHPSSSPSSSSRDDDDNEPNDPSGDIAPGTLESPSMLPRAAVPDSFIDMMKGVLRGEDRERREFGYEGKEVEIRRPEGMRHWD